MLELADGMTLDLAGVSLVVDHAPGHTPGSVTFRLPDTVFTGDLLFAGSIGRTDLPGGDYQTILDSLARVCLPLPDETVVLSGHGPADDDRRGAGVQSVPGRARRPHRARARGL